MPKPKTDVVFSKQYPKMLVKLLEMTIQSMEFNNCNVDIVCLLGDTIDELKYIDKNCIIMKK